MERQVVALSSTLHRNEELTGRSFVLSRNAEGETRGDGVYTPPRKPWFLTEQPRFGEKATRQLTASVPLC